MPALEKPSAPRVPPSPSMRSAPPAPSPASPASRFLLRTRESSPDAALAHIGPQQRPAQWVAPPKARALVIFAHGSGSSHTSPRNLQVAAALQSRGLATLLMDLLTPEEALDRRCVFDIALLARRLTESIDWAQGHKRLAALPVGLFGASTGAAAALVASALRARRVFAVVCRGGRPDLAGHALAAVTAPALMIVGSADPDVLDLNRQAILQMRSPVALRVIAGASHLFEEPGAMDRVAALSAQWFLDHTPFENAPASRSPRARPAAEQGERREAELVDP